MKRPAIYDNELCEGYDQGKHTVRGRTMFVYVYMYMCVSVCAYVLVCSRKTLTLICQ